MTKTGRRVLAGLRIGAALLAVIAAQAALTPAQALQQLRVGIASYYEMLLPMTAATDLGLFKEAGVEVEIITFKGGSTATQALLGNSITLCLCSFDHVLNLRSKGFDVVAVAGVQARNPYVLLGKANPGVSDLASLKGQKLGILAPGGATDISLRYQIKQAGLDPSGDFQLIGLGSGLPMQQAIDQGQVSAGMVNGAVLAEMLTRPTDYRVVVDFRKDDYAFETLVAQQSWLKEDPARARQVVAAVVAAEKRLQSDPALAERAVKLLFPKLDPKLVATVAQNGVANLSPDGRITRAGYQRVVDQQVFAGILKEPIAYEAAVDAEYLPK